MSHRRCNVSNTIQRLNPTPVLANARARQGTVASGQPGSSAVVSGEGSAPSRPAAGDPSAATAASTVSISRQAAQAAAAYAASDQVGVTERWNESTRERIADEIREIAADSDRTGIRVRTDLHEETGRWILRVVESETGEVLKEYPPSEYLDVVAALEEISGLLLSKEL
jgi:flagellar protein FlaG